MSWNDPEPSSEPGALPSRVGTYRGVSLASRPGRVLAFSLDALPLVILDRLTSSPLSSIAVVLSLAWVGYNFVWLQATKGFSVGKYALGYRIVAPVRLDDQRVIFTFMGPGPALLYVLGRFVDMWCGLGLLYGLWDVHRRTLAELASGTIVVHSNSVGQINPKPRSPYVRDSTRKYL